MLGNLILRNRKKSNAVLVIYTIDGKLMVDNDPDTSAGLLTSHKYGRVYGLTDPLPVMKHRRGPIGRQPVPMRGRRGWVKCGQDSIYRNAEELQHRTYVEQRRFNASLLHKWEEAMVSETGEPDERNKPLLDKVLPPVTWVGVGFLAVAAITAAIRSITA